MSILDNFIINSVTGKSKSLISYAYAPMKYEKFTTHSILQTRAFATSLFLLPGLIIPFLTVIGRLIEDKNSKMRETLKSNGMSDSAYFFSYFIWYFLSQILNSYVFPLIYHFHLFTTTSYFLLTSMLFAFMLTLFPIAILIS